MYYYVLAPAHACVVTHGKQIRRLRRSDRRDWFVPSVKTDANPKRNSQKMTSGFGISHSARKYIMPPVLTVTPNEIEQLIECVRSRPYLYHDAQRAYNAWKEIATEMEKEGMKFPIQPEILNESLLLII